MSFRVIKGTFHVVGYSPDGDSIRFKADNPANWNLLEGVKVKLNAQKHAQLRIEAIDTLETHFENQHQPLKFAEAAMTRLLQLLGITAVVWDAAHTQIVSAKDGTPGFIVTRTPDKYGRPIAFVFGPNPALRDGQVLSVDPKMAKKSANYKLLAEGLAFPTFYSGLFSDLRSQFANQARKARTAQKGLWAVDTTNAFFKVNQLSDLTATLVVLPKLFRRIVTFLPTNGGVFEAVKFVAYLKSLNEQVLIKNKVHFTHFDNLIAIDAHGGLRLTEKPEDLIFMEG
jgi:endonuclease YncB( thermonuclease family)